MKKDKEPTPQIDESLLTPEQKEELNKRHFSVGYLIFFGIIIIAFAACLIALYALGGPVG